MESNNPPPGWSWDRAVTYCWRTGPGWRSTGDAAAEQTDWIVPTVAESQTSFSFFVCLFFVISVNHVRHFTAVQNEEEFFKPYSCQFNAVTFVGLG